MLTIKPLGNAKDAMDYYSAKDNYYLKDKESLKDSSKWMGKGAEKLHLAGIVEQEPFLKLLNGELPNGEVLGITKNGERHHRVGTDVTLSAPKSVSILALALGDEAVLGAHEKAVKNVLERIEKMAAEARITMNRETAFQKTGNLVTASFLHTSSRALDPNLHTHLVILNMTERLDGMWRALSSREKKDIENLEHGFREILYQNQHYFGLIYTSTLAKEIKKLGFDIRIKDMHGNFEVDGIPQELIDHLSKRRESILKDMESKGTSSAKAAEISNGATRQKKQETDTEALIKGWKDEIQAFGVEIEALKALNAKAQEGRALVQNTELHISKNAQDAVSDALEHLSEFNTQIHHGTLVKVAFGFSMGTIEHEEIEKEISQRLQDGRMLGKENEYYTTEFMVQREKGLVASVLKNQNSGLTISDSATGFAQSILKDKSAVQIVNVNGLSNQKDLLNEFVELAERNKIKPYVLHQSKHNMQILSEEIKRETHGRFFVWLKNLFKDDIVHTVAGFNYQHGKTLNTYNKQSVVVVHDAQKLSLNDIEQLKKITDSNKGKLILLNNTASTHGFYSGNPIKTLKDNGVKEITALSARKHSEVEIAITKTAIHSAAIEQAKNIVTGKNTTLVALNNAQKEELTKEVRNELKKNGFLSIQEKETLVLTTQGLTDVEKKHIKSYSAGDRVTFKAFTSEQKHYEVVETRGDALLLKNEKGTQSIYRPKNVSEYQVSKAQKMSFSEGELIKNDRALFVNRKKYDKDSVFQVTAINKEAIELKDSKNEIISLDNGTLSKSYLSHAYVKKLNALEKEDKDMLCAAKPYQLNRNMIGELSEKARQIKLYTTNGNKARNFFNKEQFKWTAKEVSEKAPELVYRNKMYANPIIEKDISRLVEALDLDKKNLNKKEIAHLAISYAVAKCAERQAAFPHRDLMTHALKYAMGDIDFEDIAPVLKERLNDGTLIHCKTYWTTKESLEIEKEIIQTNFSHQGRLTPIESNKNRLLELPETLTKGQKDAIALVCTSKDRFNSVQGLAGVGKTTMMKEVQKIAKENGYKVVGLAPTHSAKNQLIGNAIESDTVQSELINDDHYDDKTVVIADESSMLDNVSYHELQKKVIRANARLFYVGDLTQLQSLSSGIPHEITVKTSSQKTAYMEEIVRQNPNPTLKKAAELSSNREIRASFSELDKIDPKRWVERIEEKDHDKFKESVVEIRSEDEQGEKKHAPIYKAIVDDYLSRTKDCRDNTIVIVPAHQDRKHIDKQIREGLKSEGAITGNDVLCRRLIEKNLDAADLTDIKQYEEGDVIRFGQQYHIGRKGDYFKIESIDADKNNLKVVGQDNLSFCINIKTLMRTKPSLYKEESANLAVGDKIRLRLTDENKGYVANTEYQIKSIDKGIAVIINNEDCLKLNLNEKSGQHWDYAYTNTAYSLQGSTSKYAIALALLENTKVMTHRALEIVNTRPSCQLSVYTNDREGLLNRLEDPLSQRNSDKTSAIMEFEKARAQAEKQKNITNNLNTQQEKKHTQNKKGSNEIHPIDSVDNKTIQLKEDRVDAEVLHSHLVSRADELVRHLLGEPNQSLSKKTDYRYGAKGSLSINLTKGVWNNFETGEKGNLFHLVEAEKGFTTFKEVIDYAAEFTNYKPGLVPVKQPKHTEAKEVKENNSMHKWASKYYNQSKPVQGSIVEKYLLVNRGISRYENADIRYCPDVYTKTKEGIKYLPALLSFTRNNKGEINHIQVTRLSDENANKNKNCELVKQTFGANNGYAVNLNHKGCEDITYFTEGVETGLSIVETNPKARVYTVLGKENYGNINPEIIPTKKIVLCVDNDGKSTYQYTKDRTNKIIESVNRLEEKGFNVLISLPKNLPNKIKTDLNDVLVSGGNKALSKELNSLITLKEFKTLCDRENGSKSKFNSGEHEKYVPINKEILTKNHDISQSKIIKNLQQEAIIMRESLNNLAKNNINKSVPKDRELEREL